MDLRSLIQHQLWDEISNSYLAENYKVSILDATRYLSKMIREKSGLDGDGSQLVGAAFGGDEPKLRINKLQTKSEKDEQKGFLQIITGIYSAIRNPRTHEDILDDKNSADPIIYFINYILTVIDIAKSPFIIDSFLLRVLDQDYLQNKEYTKELVKEIPKNKYFETLVEIYRQKENGDGKTLALICGELIGLLNESELKDFLAIVSDDLDLQNDEGALITTLRIVAEEYWSRIKPTAKMRVENKLIKSILSGKQQINKEKTISGAFGTWASNVIDSFTLKNELVDALFSGLVDDDIERVKYTVSFFSTYFLRLFEEDYQFDYALRGIKKLIGKGDYKAKGRLRDIVEKCPEVWLKIVKDVFEDWTNPENPEFYLADGTPLLGNIPPVEDDIPF